MDQSKCVAVDCESSSSPSPGSSGSGSSSPDLLENASLSAARCEFSQDNLERLASALFKRDCMPYFFTVKKLLVQVLQHLLNSCLESGVYNINPDSFEEIISNTHICQGLVYKLHFVTRTHAQEVMQTVGDINSMVLKVNTLRQHYNTELAEATAEAAAVAAAAAETEARPPPPPLPPTLTHISTLQ